MKAPWRRPLLVAASLCSVVPAAAVHAATLQVVVDGVRDNRGHIRVGVCSRAEFLGEACRYHAVLPARPGTVVATIGGIPPGIYGIAAYQDFDDSGHLKRNFFGLPREDVGFSRNPSLRFGPPGFDSSAIRIGDSGGRIVIALHHFGS